MAAKGSRAPRPSNSVLDARYTIETDDGELVIVRNCGRGTHPVFEARKDGKYAWLNQGDYLSSDPGVAANASHYDLREAMTTLHTG